jgi:hypothetical protein
MMEQKFDAVSVSGEQTRMWYEIMEENSSCLLNCLAFIYPQENQVTSDSVSMEYYIKTSNFDDEVTADMLRTYGKDGNSVFEKDEVVAIIRDLRGVMKSNEQLDASGRLFKRLFMGAVFFWVLLLTAMVGISYAVAILTANTQVRSDGALLVKGTTTAIATDSIANLYAINKSEAGYCLTAAEAFTIRDSVLAGRQVFVETNDEDSDTRVVQQLIPSGAVIDGEAEKYCFYTRGGSTTPICLTRSVQCTQARRRLQEFPGRRLGFISFCDDFRNIAKNMKEGSGCLGHFCREDGPNVDENGDSVYSECVAYQRNAWCDQYDNGDGTYSNADCVEYQWNFDDR